MSKLHRISFDVITDKGKVQVAFFKINESGLQFFCREVVSIETLKEKVIGINK